MHSISKNAEKYFLPVFRRLGLDIVRGEGSWLFDQNEKKYLDLASGLGVNALGYNHPAVNAAIEKQIKRNLHLSNFFVQDVQVELMKKLVDQYAPDSMGFFSNSGTEAVEGALKLVKKWANENSRKDILAMRSSFHGRTTGAISVTMQDKYQKPFAPLLPNTCALDFNDLSSLEKCVNAKTAAVFIEFVQGEGGVIPATKDFVGKLFKLKEKHGFLVIADEIQTGIGRTGKMFAFQHYDVLPDVVCFAKAVGGGLPLGGFLVKKELTGVFSLGEHGTTFGGNPLACAAGLAVVDYILKDNFRHINEMARILQNQMAKWTDKFQAITSARGIGLMQGLEIPGGVKEIQEKAILEGLILNLAAGGKVLRFLPPLIIEENELIFAFEKIENLFNQYLH